jgi:hypothetical protein
MMSNPANAHTSLGYILLDRGKYGAAMARREDCDQTLRGEGSNRILSH